ncbi:MAG: GreA/GreB family elongation factor [Candidatus Falkowbacteria bacterium]|nr:GreA/GreB family elongation factor [Candidatus Falkowbacteria bacterium]
MQTPKRKLGLYAHLKPDPHLTKEKYIELKNKLERLIKVSRSKAANEVRRLAEMGDFSENAAYQISKGRLRGINQRITDIEDHLKQAIIIRPLKNTSRVELGHIVTVLVQGKEKNLQILGSSETNPLKGIISHNSPIGAALIGKKVGEKILIKLANKEIEYEIIKIS